MGIKAVDLANAAVRFDDAGIAGNGKQGDFPRIYIQRGEQNRVRPRLFGVPHPLFIVTVINADQKQIQAAFVRRKRERGEMTDSTTERAPPLPPMPLICL